MTAKEYLSQVRRLDRRIGALMDRQRRYHEIGAWRPEGLGAAVSPGQMAALERELDGRIAEYADLVRQIEAAIDAVDKEQYRDVLKYRYLNGWSWRRISERMNLSQDWLWRLHGRALQAVRPPE